MLLVRLIDLYSFVVLASVVISWLQLPSDNPVVQVLRQVTEPVLDPLRRVLPPMGGLDFSPMVLILLLQGLKALVL